MSFENQTQKEYFNEKLNDLLKLKNIFLSQSVPADKIADFQKANIQFYSDKRKSQKS